MLEFGGSVDESFVEMLREEGLTSQIEENEEGDGMTVEDRVIHSSLAMIGQNPKTKKNSEMILNLFREFAVFPEDVPVPLEVFTALTETVAGCKASKKATMQIRASLKTLLNCKFDYILLLIALQSPGILSCRY